MSGPGTPQPYPCEDIPLNRLAFKGSHNSYEWVDKHPGTSLATLLEFDSGSPAEFGCRGLELDLVFVRRPGVPDEWEVRHEAGFRAPLGDPRRGDDHTKPFSFWLHQLRDWSAANPAHDPVTVVLDPKDSGDDPFEAALDPYLVQHLQAPIVRPSNVSNGWPTLAQLRGQFIFVISGGGAQKKMAYAKRPDALCFVDRQAPPSKTVPNADKDPRWFVNRSGVNTDKVLLDLGRRDSRLVVRVYDIKVERVWKKVLQRGANMLATDFMTGTLWATVSGGDTPCPFVEIGKEG